MDAELLARSSELAAAKNGLIVTQLTIEKLKAQLAKLRREKFGASSEQGGARAIGLRASAAHAATAGRCTTSAANAQTLAHCSQEALVICSHVVCSAQPDPFPAAGVSGHMFLSEPATP